MIHVIYFQNSHNIKRLIFLRFLILCEKSLPASRGTLKNEITLNLVEIMTALKLSKKFFQNILPKALLYQKIDFKYFLTSQTTPA